MKTAKLFSLISLLIIVCLFFYSCQETPQKQAVIKKGDNELESTIEESINAPGQKYEAPLEWNETPTKDDDFIININAKVTMPDVLKFPVIIISPQDINQEQANQFIKYFFKESSIYKQRPEGLVTQEDVLQQIQVLLKFFEDMKEKDPVEYEKVAKNLDQDIANLKSSMKDLPPSYEPEPTDTSFSSPNISVSTESNISNDLKVIDINAYFGDEIPASIYIVKNNTNKMNSYNYSSFKTRAGIPCLYNISDLSHPIGLTITYEQAEENAYKLLEDLGIQGMKLNAAAFTPTTGDTTVYTTKSAVEINPYYFTLYFTRTFDGIEWTYTNPYYNQSEVSPQYAEPWKDEFIQVMVDDSDVVSFQWISPINIVGNLSDNSTLLPYNDIMQEFIQHMQTSNAYALNDRIIKREFTINEIRFGYAKIARQDNPNQYLLVPAWDFFGTCKDTMAANISDPNYDKDNASIENNFRQSFMTINAIDGSAINRNLGY